MKPGTLTALAAIIEADPPQTEADRNRIVCLVTGAARTESGPRVLSRSEAAERLGVCVRVIDGMSAAGILPRVTLPGRRRAAGVRDVDVERIIEGRHQKQFQRKQPACAG